MRAQNSGFSLVELMTVVVVVGILAAVAIPNYQSYMVKGRRADAQELLLDIQNRQQQYLLDARVFTDKLDSTGLNMTKEQWDCTTVATACSNAYYTVTVALTAGPPPGFTLRATATGTQASDGDLTLTDTGAKTGKW